MRLARVKLIKKFVLIVLFLSSCIAFWLFISSGKVSTDSALKSSYRDRVTEDSLKKNCQTQTNQYKVTVNGQTYPKKVPLPYNTSIDFECMNTQNQEPKIILAWSGHYGIKFNKTTCPVKNCEFTRDRQLQDNASYVLFHGPDFAHNPKQDQPANNVKRPYFQRWIFSVFESPLNTKTLNAIAHNYNGVFNLTATYLEESDFDGIYMLQSGLRWEKNDGFDPNKDFTIDKTGLVTALISNCQQNDRVNRLGFIQEMNKTVKVDIYGSCGMKCPVGNCRDFLYKKYLFVFAGENSMCKDYITEKFFLAIKNDVVPIVLGGGDYEKYVPKSGFINALDFPNPGKLGEYLSYLKSNKTAYNEFFKWKQHVTFQNEPANLICSMCIQLNLEAQFGMRTNVIKDLGNYWNTRHCRT